MIDVKLPNIGEGIAEGEIVKWNVQPGSRIELDQPLLEVLTDKASVEIPSPGSGIVQELLFQEGELAPVGQVIARLSSAEAASEQALPAQAAPVAVITASAPNGSEPMATPSVRRYAREQSVELAEIRGSGPYGRILREDVQRAVQTAQPQAQVSQPQPAQLPAGSAGQESEERIPLRGIRRKIAEQMVKAKFTAPDFLYADEADLSELVALRQELSPELKTEGIKLTYLPFVVKAVVSALKKYPSLNASLDDERQEIVLKKHYHIGIATASPNGLFVPVIQHADQLSILELAQEIERLSGAVRQGQIKAEDMRGGTFTITNIGAIGGLVSAPIINHPEVAILGFNKIYQKPMVYQNEIAIRWACTLSLSFDHRVVDGSDGAYFTNHLIRLLQNPKRLLLEA